MAIVVLYRFSTVGATASIPMIGELQPFIYTYFVMVLTLNVLTTGTWDSPSGTEQACLSLTRKQ